MIFLTGKVRVFIKQKSNIAFFWDLKKQWCFHVILVLNLRFQSKIKKYIFVQFLWFTSKFQKFVVFWKTYKTFRNKNNSKKRVWLVNPYVPQVAKGQIQRAKTFRIWRYFPIWAPDPRSDFDDSSRILEGFWEFWSIWSLCRCGTWTIRVLSTRIASLKCLESDRNPYTSMGQIQRAKTFRIWRNFPIWAPGSS